MFRHEGYHLFYRWNFLACCNIFITGLFNFFLTKFNITFKVIYTN